MGLVRTVLASGVVGALLVGSGCGTATKGESCDKTSDCALTLTCDVGVCIDPSDGTCIRSGSTQTCTDNSECCSGVCLSFNDQCSDRCEVDTDCASACCGPLGDGVEACLPEFEC